MLVIDLEFAHFSSTITMLYSMGLSIHIHGECMFVQPITLKLHIISISSFPIELRKYLQIYITVMLGRSEDRY